MMQSAKAYSKTTLCMAAISGVSHILTFNSAENNILTLCCIKGYYFSSGILLSLLKSTCNKNGDILRYSNICFKLLSSRRLKQICIFITLLSSSIAPFGNVILQGKDHANSCRHTVLPASKIVIPKKRKEKKQRMCQESVIDLYFSSVYL